MPLCNASATPGPAYLIGDYSSSAQFFVFVGVIGFLISLAYIIIYTLFDDFYMSSDFMPKIVRYSCVAISAYSWLGFIEMLCCA